MLKEAGELLRQAGVRAREKAEKNPGVLERPVVKKHLPSSWWKRALNRLLNHRFGSYHLRSFGKFSTNILGTDPGEETGDSSKP